MQTENTTTELALQERVQRLSESVERLNARIARLAVALDVALDKDSEVERVLQRETNAAGESPRQRRMREELRGLLVLRYGVARSVVNRVGVDAARHIMESAQDQLVREGFKPGADGANLKRLFDQN